MASVAGTLLLVFLTTTLAAAAFAVSASDVADRNASIHRLREAASRLTTAALSQNAEAYEILAGGGVEDVDQYVDAATILTAAEAELVAAAGADSALHVIVERVNRSIDDWQYNFGNRVVEAIKRGDRPDISTSEDGETYEAAMLGGLAQLERALTERRLSTATSIARASSILITGLLIGCATIVLTLLIGGRWLFRSIGSPLGRLNRTATALIAGEDVTFEPEHDDEIGTLARVLEQLRREAAQRYEVARKEAAKAAAFNQLSEMMSFALDEDDLVKAAVGTLARLVPSAAGDVLLVNASRNRLAIQASWGRQEPEGDGQVNLDRIDRCPGIRRATAYNAVDVSDEMTVRCPAHSIAAGSLLCVPMPALGEMVGVVHLASPSPRAFDEEDVRVASRIAEQVALAIANARLMATMEGLAMTDPLTGMHNARFFDPYLEQELAASERDHASLAVIMIDLDNFKRFNDAYGHPAGDEALKAFARAIRTSIRSSDVVARYGGEEFIVCARHSSLEDASRLAEKIRIAVEQTVVELGPGRFARITASFGVASTADRRLDRQSLVRAADEALYQAKMAGRNRVESASGAGLPADTQGPETGAPVATILVLGGDRPPA